MQWYKNALWKLVGLNCTKLAYVFYALWMVLHAAALTGTLASGDSAWTLAGLVITLAHKIVLFMGTVWFVLDLAHEGVSVFGHFGLMRAIASFFVVLTNTIFYMQLYYNGEAFDVPDDVLATNTAGERFNLLNTAVYGAAVVLSGTGNTSILPVQWYSRMVMLPHLLFAFLISVVVFGAFVKAISKRV